MKWLQNIDLTVSRTLGIYITHLQRQKCVETGNSWNRTISLSLCLLYLKNSIILLTKPRSAFFLPNQIKSFYIEIDNYFLVTWITLQGSSIPLSFRFNVTFLLLKTTTTQLLKIKTSTYFNRTVKHFMKLFRWIQSKHLHLIWKKKKQQKYVPNNHLTIKGESKTQVED